jgi:hypothetical protein
VIVSERGSKRASEVAESKLTALDHEALNVAVEEGGVIVARRAQCKEVLTRPWALQVAQV